MISEKSYNVNKHIYHHAEEGYPPLSGGTIQST